MEQLAQSLPLLLTLLAPGWHLVVTQNLTTELVQVPTSIIRSLVTGANCKSFGTQAQWGSRRKPGPLSGKLTATSSHAWQLCPPLRSPR